MTSKSRTRARSRSIAATSSLGRSARKENDHVHIGFSSKWPFQFQSFHLQILASDSVSVGTFPDVPISGPHNLHISPAVTFLKSRGRVFQIQYIRKNTNYP